MTEKNEIVGAKASGKCSLCTGKAKEKPIFVVKLPGFAGDICGEHLHMLTMQSKKEPGLYVETA
jgi:hypothetical protein